MAQKTLNATIVLGGRVDNTFGQIGTALTNVGATVDQLSQKLINFGRESIEVYRGYQDSMLDAQVALSTTYGRGTKALGDVMKTLDQQATEWAASTIFHTDDVANAIAEAAHANWDLEKILTGIPAAMRLAQAGGLDLSTSVDFIVKSTNAAGISFEELDGWIDEWTFAANSSAADVRTLGEAMLRMGSTMKFAENRSELLTLLAVLHDAGTTGANAGTLLRNSMIRILAPTKKAGDIMDTLGVSLADIDEAMNEVDGDTIGAMKRLHELGFSAYDEKGNLKGFLDIFTDLELVTRNMAEEEKNKIISSIFPTRTLTGALALMEAAKNGWGGLYKALMHGDATGYGKYGAEIMMSGLTGAIETFNSKVERLKQVTGEELSEQAGGILGNFGKLIDLLASGAEDNGVSAGLGIIEGIANAVGDFADNMGKMDPALFDALVEGLGTIAAIGPLIGIAGFGFSTLGWALGTHTGRIAVAAIAISALAAGVSKFREAKFQEAFGNLDINTEGLDTKMETLKTQFEKATAPTQAFANALQASVDNYKTASETFSATMMQDLLQDQTLSGEELQKKLKEYETLGSDMIKAVKKGIQDSADMSAAFWKGVVTGTNTGEEGNNLLAGIEQALESEKNESLANVTAIGEELKNAITDAWGDGNLSEEERLKIKEYFRQLNEAIAEAEREAKSEQDFIARRKMMDKAQGLDYGQMQEYVNNTILPQREAELAWADDHYQSEIYRMEYRRNKAQDQYNALMAEGRITEALSAWNDIQLYNKNIEGAKGIYSQYRSGIYSGYDKMIMDWYAGTLNDSDMRGGVPGLLQAAGFLTSGAVSELDSLRKFAFDQGVGSDWGQLTEYYRREVEALGGIDEMKQRIADYNKSGDADLMNMANSLQSILAAYAILQNDLSSYSGLLNNRDKTADDFAKLLAAGFFGEDTMDYIRALQNGEFGSELFRQADVWMTNGINAWFDAAAADLGKTYNLDFLSDWLGKGVPDDYKRDFAVAKLLGMNEGERNEWLLGSAGSNAFTESGLAAARKALSDYEQGFYGGIPGAFHEGMTDNKMLELEADVQLAEGAVVNAMADAQSELDSQEPVEEEMEIPNGADAARLAGEAAQAQADSMDIEFHATLNVDTVFSGIGGLGLFGGKTGSGSSGGGGWLSQGLSLLPKKASGGREDRPSIFAEAGPEWFIPEEHSGNTAGLLLAAMRASGFTIGELAAMAGARMFATGGSIGSALNWGSIATSAARSGSSYGGGGSGSSGGVQVQYSPVIHAENATGVSTVLKEDKKRLENWMNDWWERKELYQSMVAYQ